ncbi:MAG TPA: aminotransferase class I/II-fold pyridoxal phosphate-dependent enzyme [Myxococcota bacterium]|nr:aminotransferase class I/II-fold pyridoxal phosphate-dependent enzyme [Myxococcota bacterium]
MPSPISLGRAAERELAQRGFTRRQMLRIAALAGAASALPFSSEHALAQLSNAGVIPEDAVRINGNEFPDGPSEAALAALADVAKRGNRYQYPETEALVAAAAKLEELSPQHFSVYPGSSLALHHAVIAFTGPKRALVTAEPGYEAAARAAQFIGAKVVSVPLRRDGAHDLPAMLAAAKSEPVGLFYVCNPNNPTGTVTPRVEIESLVANKPKDAVVLLDEAYIHLCDEKPGVDLVRAGKDVVLLRTFSKIFGMAGLRAGFAIAQKDLLARMTGWNTGAMPVTAMAAARVMLGEPDWIAARKRGNAERRKDLMQFFDAHGFGYTPSVANHLMVDARMPTQKVIDGLKQQSVYVGRAWPVWPTHVRVSIGSSAEMARFKTAFLEVTTARG